MTPPSEPTSILDARDNFDKYYKAAKEDSTRVLALVAQGIDDVKAEQVVQGENFLTLQTNFKDHENKRIDKAHVVPANWKMANNPIEKDTSKWTTSTAKKIYILITIITSAIVAVWQILGGVVP